MLRRVCDRSNGSHREIDSEADLHTFPSREFDHSRTAFDHPWERKSNHSEVMWNVCLAISQDEKNYSTFRSQPDVRNALHLLRQYDHFDSKTEGLAP